MKQYNVVFDGTLPLLCSEKKKKKVEKKTK